MQCLYMQTLSVTLSRNGERDEMDQCGEDKLIVGGL